MTSRPAVGLRPILRQLNQTRQFSAARISAFSVDEALSNALQNSGDRVGGIASSSQTDYPQQDRVRAPYGTRIRKPFQVNEDVGLLKSAIETFLGAELGRGLPDELKWQAVTHKSFDHGLQPHNEKLAFFGRRAVYMETTLGLLNSPPEAVDTSPKPSLKEELEGKFAAPKPFMHEDYRNLHSLSYERVGQLINKVRLYDLAKKAGIPEVMRWKPAHNDDMQKSGRSEIAVDCLFGIIGALLLQRGGVEGSKAIRERILRAL